MVKIDVRIMIHNISGGVEDCSTIVVCLPELQ